MPLNKSKGQMYPWITHTFNTIKGICPHNCSYCYMKRWKNQKPVRFDEKELKTDLGKSNFIFVGSSCDMFADDIPYEWVIKTMEYLKKFDNKYLFQSKNPNNFNAIPIHGPSKYVLCTTIETNRVYPEIMCKSPDPTERALAFANIPIKKKYITIEPIMDFDLWSLVELIRHCRPLQVNIGADSGNNKLPEPSRALLWMLISELECFTVVKQKKNLKRLMNSER